MKELREKELEEIIEEIEELGKLTIEELEKKGKELDFYGCEIYRKRKAVETAIRAKRMVNLYEKGGFRGLYGYFNRFRSHLGPRGEREDMEDGIPF
ncbi:hypothetical protein ES695_06635 [Candidatus Atribacteria bacterium 1244-E10-H5-B2]|nr:MAG: hypothetical protein ES695_06635 [Candidatus Atribacteria bacterium 1244-E10-H5-B2]